MGAPYYELRLRILIVATFVNDNHATFLINVADADIHLVYTQKIKNSVRFLVTFVAFFLFTILFIIFAQQN